MGKGKLYVVATPIGNLGDITLRALEILKTAGAIACEDTRRTHTLLSHYQIHPKEMFSLHKFNERSRAEKILHLLASGVDVALVSDAGTPALNDPGYLLIARAAGEGYKIEPIPGPSALASALCASGLPSDSFVFDGFLPRKSGQRKRRFSELCKEERTLGFFESPHRVAKSLADALEVFGNRRAVLARELTKMHEEIIRENLETLLEKVKAWPKSRGEMVLVIEGYKKPARNRETASAETSAISDR